MKLDNASWMPFTKVVCRGKVGTLTTDNAGYIRRAKNNIKGDSSRRTGWAWTTCGTVEVPYYGIGNPEGLKPRRQSRRTRQTASDMTRQL